MQTVNNSAGGSTLTSTFTYSQAIVRVTYRPCIEATYYDDSWYIWCIFEGSKTVHLQANTFTYSFQESLTTGALLCMQRRAA